MAPSFFGSSANVSILPSRWKLPVDPRKTGSHTGWGGGGCPLPMCPCTSSPPVDEAQGIFDLEREKIRRTEMCQPCSRTPERCSVSTSPVFIFSNRLLKMNHFAFMVLKGALTRSAKSRRRGPLVWNAGISLLASSNLVKGCRKNSQVLIHPLSGGLLPMRLQPRCHSDLDLCTLSLHSGCQVFLQSSQFPEPVGYPGVTNLEGRPEKEVKLNELFLFLPLFSSGKPNFHRMAGSHSNRS